MRTVSRLCGGVTGACSFFYTPRPVWGICSSSQCIRSALQGECAHEHEYDPIEGQVTVTSMTATYCTYPANRCKAFAEALMDTKTQLDLILHHMHQAHLVGTTSTFPPEEEESNRAPENVKKTGDLQRHIGGRNIRAS